MEKIRKIMKILVIISALLLAVFLAQKSMTSDIILDKYSYTTAVCNESNFCQDYFINCDGEEVESSVKVTGASIQHNSDWVDTRENKNFCESN